MKKMLLLSFIAAAAAVSAAPTDAHALNTCNAGVVTLLNAYAPYVIGTWHPELLEYSDYNGYEACSYFVKWINGPGPVGNASNLFLDEFITPGFADCDYNSISSVPTIVTLTPGPLSLGFNKFGYKVPVDDILLASTGAGIMSGVIWFAGTRFPYNVRVTGL
jgi:hypothetical protein